VAGLSSLQRGLRSLSIAQLADQDDVRILTERAAQGLAEVVRVESDLALVDNARVVWMQDLDRVLDRDDVLLPCPVHAVDHCGERRRLSGARCTRDEYEPAVLVRKPAHALRQRQLLKRRDVLRDDAERERGRAALAERVDADPWQVLVLIGDVEVTA